MRMEDTEAVKLAIFFLDAVYGIHRKNRGNFIWQQRIVLQKKHRDLDGSFRMAFVFTKKYDSV